MRSVREICESEICEICERESEICEREREICERE